MNISKRNSIIFVTLLFKTTFIIRREIEVNKH